MSPTRGFSPLEVIITRDDYYFGVLNMIKGVRDFNKDIIREVMCLVNLSLMYESKKDYCVVYTMNMETGDLSYKALKYGTSRK